MDKATKSNVMQEYATKDGDTGSTQVQIAVLTTRILELTEHMKQHPKDTHTRRGLLAMVSRRRKLQKYLRNQDLAAYSELIKRLGLRR